MSRIFLIFLSLLLSLTIGFAQIPSSQAKFSLLTCASGDMAQDAWGHSAIRFYDPVNQIDVVYNYGSYDFAAPNFLLNFLKGKLDYNLVINSYSAFLGTYNSYERSVYEQDFDIENTEVDQLYRFLQNNAQLENRTYQYDFFFDNCSTRIRSMLSGNLTGFTYEDRSFDKITFRQLLDVDLEHRDWTDFGIDLILGATCDVVANYEQTLFLPNTLSENLENATYNKLDSKVNLINNTYLVLDHEMSGELRQQSYMLTPVNLFSFLAVLELLILLFRNKLNAKLLNIYDYIWIVVLAICSIIMMLMWFATDHVTCEQNWNLLWANPGYILMLFLFWISNSNTKYYLLGFIIACTAFALLGWWIIPQQYHIAFIPIVITMLLKLIRF